MNNRFCLLILITALIMIIPGCASTPEEIARKTETARIIKNIEGKWKQKLINDEPSTQTESFHYEFKLKKNTVIVYTVRDTDNGLDLKGDTAEFMRFKMNGRKLLGEKEINGEDVEVRGAINESLNEIFWTWQEPGVTDLKGNIVFFKEILNR